MSVLINESTFGYLVDGQEVKKYTLINKNNFELNVISYGAAIQSIILNDNKDKKTFNDAELDNDVKKMFDAIARRDFPDKYDPEKTLFVYVV
jgi:aldose 1-epimerase